MIVPKSFEGVQPEEENRSSVMSAVNIINDPSQWPLSCMPVKREWPAIGRMGIDYEFGIVNQKGGRALPVVLLSAGNGQVHYESILELVADGWRPD